MTGLVPQESTKPTLDLLLLAPERFDLFAALRIVEANFPERPRLGEGKRARDEPLRLGQPPFLIFPPSQIASAHTSARTGHLVLNTYVMGLFGPQGPLPLHVTVRALDRRRAHDLTLEHFVDIFHHRLIALFYRAWAKARPTVEYDRPAIDRFARRLGALTGAATPALLKRSALPDGFVRYAAGLFAIQRKTPEALERLIRLFFEVPVCVREFIGAWLDIPIEDRTRLGDPNGMSRLGTEAVLGVRIHTREHRFRILIGPLYFADFERFLPSGRSLPAFSALVRRAADMYLDWSLQLLLRRDEVPVASLSGRARLGWTSWLHTRARVADADDLVLQGEVAKLQEQGEGRFQSLPVM